MDATRGKLTLIPGQSLDMFSALYNDLSVLNYQDNNLYTLNITIDHVGAHGNASITSQLSSETPANIDISKKANITARMKDGTESKNICYLTAHYKQVN